MRSQKLMRGVWPAFLADRGLEIVVFATVDPQSLHWSGNCLARSS